MTISVGDISRTFAAVAASREARFPEAKRIKDSLPQFLQDFVDQEYKTSRFDKSYFVVVVDVAQDANDLVTLLLKNPDAYAEYKAIPSTKPNINDSKIVHIERLINVREAEMLCCGMTYSLAERYLEHIESQNK